MKARHLIGITCLALVTACGGGDERPALVSFGDSLSDVGSYRTPGVVALGGGQFTVNGAPLDDSGAVNWTEWLAAAIELARPCAARTGLEASGPLAALAAPVADHEGCVNYAQGGARVSANIGPWNKALLGAGDPSGYLGQLTEPVARQVSNHLQRQGGQFSATDLVTVWAGANDLFMQLFELQAAVAAGADPQQAAQAAVQAMGGAGAELATIVRERIVGNGAQRVVVLNLPDVSLTPFGRAQSAQTRALMSAMTDAFNGALSAGLTGEQRVLPIDAFAITQAIAEDPAVLGFGNVTTPACDPARTAIPSALVCAAPGTVVAGDVSRHQFADDVHPTPYAHMVFALFVYATLFDAGWVAH